MDLLVEFYFHMRRTSNRDWLPQISRLLSKGASRIPASIPDSITFHNESTVQLRTTEYRNQRYPLDWTIETKPAGKSLDFLIFSPRIFNGINYKHHLQGQIWEISQKCNYLIIPPVNALYHYTRLI